MPYLKVNRSWPRAERSMTLACFPQARNLRRWYEADAGENERTPGTINKSLRQ
jgi:hypothetical protein